MSWSTSFFAKTPEAAVKYLRENEYAKSVPDPVKQQIIDQIEAMARAETDGSHPYAHIKGYAWSVETSGHLDTAWGGNATFKVGRVQFVE